MIIYMDVKCSDSCYLELYDGNGESLGEYSDYVPDFFPGQHYGDNVILEIDVDTGKILNWVKPNKKQLRETFGVKL
jgi:hypothetical protein